MKFDAIIFDLGGVLIDLDYNKTIHAFESLGVKDFSELYSQASQTELFSDFETGQISAQRFINELLHYLPAGTSPNKVVHAWNEMILEVPVTRIDLLNKLRKTHRLYMLSNTNELHVPIVKREWLKVTEKSLESYFDRVYLSHELKMRKPHPETFAEVCRREGLTPEKTLFIDDTEQHILGAQKAGLITHHLKNASEFDQLFS